MPNTHRVVCLHRQSLPLSIASSLLSHQASHLLLAELLGTALGYLSKMRFNVAAAAASAALLAGVSAEEQKVLQDESSSVAESATQAAPELPTFTVRIPQFTTPGSSTGAGGKLKTGH